MVLECSASAPANASLGTGQQNKTRDCVCDHLPSSDCIFDDLLVRVVRISALTKSLASSTHRGPGESAIPEDACFG